MNRAYTYFLLTMSLFILACENTPQVDVSSISWNREVQRLEGDLFAKEGPLEPSDLKILKEKYGDFYRMFVEGIVAVGNAEDSSTIYYLNHFKQNSTVKEVADECLKQWADISIWEDDLILAFKRFNVLFPERPVPQIYTYLSAFSYTIVVDDSILGIGLDMYLGRDHEFYTRLGIPRYKCLSMSGEYIPTDCMRSWISTEFELESQSNDLLSHMIYHGKILYALDLLLPDTEDSIKIAFSADQMKWVNENEKDIWFHFANEDLFYSKNSSHIQNYIGEAPFTPGFPEGSPGRIGQWLGWQIVKKYMEQGNPLDLKGLFEEKSAQKIFNISKYKPI